METPFEAFSITVQLFEKALQFISGKLKESSFIITDSLKEQHLGQIFLNYDIWTPNSSVAPKRSLESNRQGQIVFPIKKANVKLNSNTQSKMRQDVANSLTNQMAGSTGSVTFGKDGLGNLLCPLCQKKFTKTYTANRHFESVHGNILYKCHICDYNTSRKDALKAHGMKKHGLTDDMAQMMVKNYK